MCVYLFHPGSHLKVKFATEAIDLKDGSSIDVIDLLLKNDSSSALDRVHLVYPHPIPLEQSETRFFKDETATWLDPGHRFNTFYQQGTVQMAIGQTASAGSAGDGGTSIGGYVEVTMPKPSDPSVDLHYKGNVQGRCQLVPYELNDQTKLDEDHWRLLEWLGWSVYTLKFNQFPIQPGEKRWLRLHASGGVQRQNRRSKSDRRKEKYLVLPGNLWVSELARGTDVRGSGGTCDRWIQRIVDLLPSRSGRAGGHLGSAHQR